MSHPLQCRCGTLKGAVAHPEKAIRAVCYCQDCQAFARFLGDPDTILDPLGGTDVVAVHPADVSFSAGQDMLACMALSETGLLRWYARCCHTPIGNIGRDPKVAHVGLIHNCLATSSAALDAAFGPVQMHVNTGSAHGKPPAMVLGMLKTMPRFAWQLLRARLDGSYKRNPFFKDEHGTPIVAPQIVAGGAK
jgi:hypothetical protein